MNKHADYRLFQLISPSLPVGAFSYSQGLEWAIEEGWVDDESSFKNWLESIALDSLANLELPILRRLYDGFDSDDTPAIQRWSEWLYASRETMELRQEEQQRGKTMAKLLCQLEMLDEKAAAHPMVAHNPLSGFAYAGVQWGISIDDLCSGYAWSWLENTVMAGVKLIPLGQTSGQRMLISLSETLDEAVEQSRCIQEDDIGNFAPAQAIASSCHENQYSRLFRS
ncbi:urease accessory protein UreF [Enterovibrio coralii]|uniref:Urease accessory protein UreF n=1 Tax=Enterovibrio coralii TaxID=294935 RepID=A0A135ICX9_9GAMM|nr:urease accessory protein UreF [Enterovibrio coralii]KXF83331.1 urease accessory protein UreF [Enterovibrio coralii]